MFWSQNDTVEASEVSYLTTHSERLTSLSRIEVHEFRLDQGAMLLDFDHSCSRSIEHAKLLSQEHPNE